MNCTFCKIISKEIVGDIIYEESNSIGILDINPISPGHTLVVPKRHTETILELEDEEIGQLFSSVRDVVKVLKEKINPDGFTIGINHGKYAGQVVPHIHIHIIPRYDGDGGGSIHKVVNNVPDESIEDLKNKILNK